ncbi:Bacterial membrane protein YfhO [compost metagenome]
MQQRQGAAETWSGWRRGMASSEACLLAIWALLCLPWLLGLRIIPFDAAQQFFPALSFVAEQWLHGQAAWWNPYLYGGYPQVADPQMMSFQPSMLLPMLLAPSSLHWFTVVVLLHVLGGGLGSVRLARHYGMARAPQLVFALVMMFGAVAASRLQHTPMIVSFSYLPWLWLGLSRLRRQGRLRDALLAGVSGGLCALQLTQVTYLIALGGAVYAAAALLLAPAGLRAAVLRGVAVTAALAATISAPQWLATLAWLPWTNRSVIDLHTSLGGGIHWTTLATLLSGNVFEQGRGTYWGPGDTTQDYLYLGAVPLALWLGWGAAVVRAQPWRARIALAVIVLAVAWALGGRTPLFPWLFAWLPGLDLFRRPADALFAVVPAAAWLAAQAMQQARTASGVQPHWPALLVVAGLAAWTVHAVLPAHPAALGWLLFSALLMALALLAARHRRAGAVLAVLVLDMLVFNVGTDFNTGSASKSVLDGARDGPAQRAYRVLSAQRGDGIPERAAVFGLRPLTNGASVHGLALVNGYNPIMAADYLQMVGMPGEPPLRVQDVPRTPWAPDLDAPLFDLLGLRWVLASTAFPAAHAHGDRLFVAERRSSMPRVLVPRSVHRHGGRLPDAAAFATTDFREAVWLPATTRSACADTQSGRARVGAVHYQPDRVRVDYQADAPAWLVVNEVHAPGWQGQVDGARLAVVRGNGLFRAVCVPAGTHTLTLSYRPSLPWERPRPLRP